MHGAVLGVPGRDSQTARLEHALAKWGLEWPHHRVEMIG